MTNFDRIFGDVLSESGKIKVSVTSKETVMIITIPEMSVETWQDNRKENKKIDGLT